jgi:hypothetical protein
MRTTLFILLALLAATPSLASPQERGAAAAASEPRGERADVRWQGRHHWLYDDAVPGAATTTATDGYNANAKGDCRSVPVRMKRSDGATVVRRVNRCK